MLTLGCSKNDDHNVPEPTVSELLEGVWKLNYSKFSLSPGFEPMYPNTPVFVEIVLEHVEFTHWELGDVTSDISVYEVNPETLERKDTRQLYQWIEFEKVFENFDTQDCHHKEFILEIDETSLIWQRGPGCIGLTWYGFYDKVY